MVPLARLCRAFVGLFQHGLRRGIRPAGIERWRRADLGGGVALVRLPPGARHQGLERQPRHAGMRTVAQEILEHNRQFRETNSTDLVTKVARMKEHVFPFYRATAHLFYRDMAALPSSPYTNAQTGRCWLAGDAHLANFGAMRDAAGTEVFGVSDFDEAYIGQSLWDLRRLAVSLLLADYAKDISLAERRAAIAAMATAYLACMADLKG
eukprot:gene33571-37940_t